MNLEYTENINRASFRYCEYSAHLHEHFEEELLIKGQNYLPPVKPGYSTKFKKSSLKEYEFPNGSYWKQQSKWKSETILK